MAATFPTSPTNGQTAVVGGVSFVYDSTADVWNQLQTTPSSPTIDSAVLNTAVSGSAVLDEDNMASNSATKLATQQSIKAYVDGKDYLSLIDEDNMSSNSATRPPSQQSVKAYVDAATDFTTKLTANRIEGINSIKATHGSTVTITVTSATKTSAHRYNGSGSSLGYFLDGVESPFLVLFPGRTYRFDQSDSSMATHGIRFYQTADKQNYYSTNVNEVGTAGQAGAYIEITITDSTPGVLHYQCNNHAYMGNAMFNNTASGDFNTLLNKPTTIAGYGITDSPSALTDLSITDGDANMVLKTDGSGNFSFASISALGGGGIQSVVEDTTPQAGGPFDFKQLSSDPSSGVNAGQVYYNTTESKLYLYTGSVWEEIQSENQTFLTRQVITHGFVMGGYKDSSPWRNVNTMVHATDVMTNNGDVLPNSQAYTSGVCSLVNGYLWSTDNTFAGTSAASSKFNMTTYSGSVGPSSRHARNDMATVFKEHEMAWLFGGGNGNADVFNISSETFYGADQGINSISGDSAQSGVASHSGETKAYIWQATNDARTITFATGTAVSIGTPTNKPGHHSQQKGIPTKLGKGYAGNEGGYNGGYNLRVWNYSTEAYSTVSKPVGNCGEENFDMGQAHQYMMGCYDGAQNNRGWRFSYSSDSGYELGSGSIRTGVPGGSSGHCVWRGS